MEGMRLFLWTAVVFYHRQGNGECGSVRDLPTTFMLGNRGLVMHFCTCQWGGGVLDELT